MVEIVVEIVVVIAVRLLEDCCGDCCGDCGGDCCEIAVIQDDAHLWLSRWVNLTLYFFKFFLSSLICSLGSRVGGL